MTMDCINDYVGSA